MVPRFLNSLARRRREAPALEDLYDRLSPRLYGYLADLLGNAALAEDLLQQTWIRTIERGDGLKTPLEPWMFAVARNLAFDTLRRARRQRGWHDSHGDRASAPPVRLAADATAALRAAIRELPVECRDVVLLRYYSECPLAEIAGILECPLGTVGTRLRRALSILKKELSCV